MTVHEQPTGRWHEWTIGDRLRIARESVTERQKDFAEISGIARGTISRYENDATRPKVVYVRQWALATGYSFEWLMTGTIPGHNPDGSPPVTGPATRGYRRHHRLIAA